MNTLLIAGNSICAAFINGEQVPELQANSLAALWAAHAESLGYDPTTFQVETFDHRKWRLVRDPDPGLSNGWRLAQL